MITKTCEICGCLFQVKNYRAKTARFCSQKCGGVWHAKTRLPEVVRKSMQGNKWRSGKRPSNAFSCGNTPWNRNKKGIHLSPATEFKKGAESNRKEPVGSVKIRSTKNGCRRAFVKVSQPRSWKLRAVYVWELSFGPVPNGCVIHHHDRNPLNDNLDNLRCMSRKAHIDEHRGEFRK